MRILVLTQPGDGHLNPLVPLARTLEGAGHEVQVATAPSFVSDVERVGLSAIGVGPAFRWDAAVDLWPDGVEHQGAGSLAFWAQRYNRDITVPFIEAVREVVAERRPDFIVAELAAGAWAQAIHDFDGIPFIVTGWATEPGYDPLTADEAGANEARTRLGLPPIEDVTPSMWVTFTPPRWGALDGPPLPQTRRYRLPALRSDERPEPTSRPYVYGTLGTVFNTTRRLLKVFIEAIDGGGWSGLVTVGRNNDPQRFGPHSDRIEVAQYVPQADVLDVADLMACHGGLGSMLGAIEVACPMVVVPLGADQLDNAAKAKRLGIATVIDPANADIETVRSSIASTLASAEHRAASDDLRLEVAGMPDLGQFVADIEGLK